MIDILLLVEAGVDIVDKQIAIDELGGVKRLRWLGRKLRSMFEIIGNHLVIEHIMIGGFDLSWINLKLPEVYEIMNGG